VCACLGFVLFRWGADRGCRDCVSLPCAGVLSVRVIRDSVQGRYCGPIPNFIEVRAPCAGPRHEVRRLCVRVYVFPEPQPEPSHDG